MRKKYYWEDFKKNGKISLGFKSISKDEIIDFAKKYDPQYFHTNEEKAKESQFNGLIASGWQTCCIVMKLMCDSYLLETDSMGSPGLENVKWLKPVRPNDTLEVFRTILETRKSSTKKNLGILKLLFEAFNQNGELVFSTVTIQMVGRRPKQTK